LHVVFTSGPATARAEKFPHTEYGHAVHRGYVDQSAEPSTDTASSLAERARHVRASLAGQVLWDPIETARATYGPLYSLTELQRRIGDTLSPRLGCRRAAICEPIETYRGTGSPTRPS
jgi:hypothetical protein